MLAEELPSSAILCEASQPTAPSLKIKAKVFRRLYIEITKELDPGCLWGGFESDLGSGSVKGEDGDGGGEGSDGKKAEEIGLRQVCSDEGFLRLWLANTQGYRRDEHIC